MSGLKAGTDRITIFLRLMGAAFLIIGLLTAYLTSISPLIPILAQVFYFISGIFMVSGAIVLVAKLKD